MTCHCGSTALWYVGSKGFCRSHKAEAYTAAADAKRLQQSVNGLLALDHQHKARENWLNGITKQMYITKS